MDQCEGAFTSLRYRKVALGGRNGEPILREIQILKDITSKYFNDTLYQDMRNKKMRSRDVATIPNNANTTTKIMRAKCELMDDMTYFLLCDCITNMTMRFCLHFFKQCPQPQTI